MSQSVKIIARYQKINKQGLIPIYIRVIVDRRIKFISLGYSVKRKDWDEKNSKVKKSHPNFKHLNALISKKVSEFELMLLEAEIKSSTSPLTYIETKLNGRDKIDFYTYAKEQIRKDENKAKISSLKNYNTSVSKLKSFTGNRILPFEEITSEFLERYDKHLIELNNKVNTRHNNLKYIRKWYKQAIRDKIVSPENDPFHNFKIKREAGSRVSLTEEEIQRIENLKPKVGSRLFDTKNIWLTSYYSCGLRISDSLQIQWKNIEDGKLKIRTQKTGKFLAIRLPKKAVEIIESYKRKNSKADDFVFPFLNNQKDYSNPKILFQEISAKSALTNKLLKKIAKLAKIEGKILSNHIARHSFASISLKKEIPLKIISELLLHQSIRTTEGYAKIEGNVDLDKYLEKFHAEEKNK